MTDLILILTLTLGASIRQIVEGTTPLAMLGARNRPALPYGDSKYLTAQGKRGQ